MTKLVVNKFKHAVEKTPDIHNCYQVGLSALGANSAKVYMANNLLCNGSVEIDACTIKKYPRLNRWDYCFGYNNKAYFVEVHSASTSEVRTVLKKLEWLKDWLISEAPELDKIKGTPAFYWIQSGKYDIRPGSPQARAVAAAGIKLEPISRLKL